MGDVQFVEVSDRLVVANVAGQDRYGTNQRQTNYEALKTGLEKVRQQAQDLDLPVYLPYQLGSGLAGGATTSERQQTWETVQAIIHDVIPDAQIVYINWQWTENPTPLDARQVQVQRSQMVIPIVMDYLKVKGKSFVQGETFTAFWDASNGILHLLSNADNEPKLTAKYLGKDQGDKPLWEISPLVHEQEGKLTPRLSEEDVELLKTHQPKIEKLLLAQQKQQTQRRI